VPDDPVGFVHGDLWSGNTLWRGAELAAVIDWDCAGLGAADVDLGSLRCDAAMCYGLEAPDHVLASWQRQAERPAESLVCAAQRRVISARSEYNSSCDCY
jgi:aminoglycoside phosphotransferase (APT) family kinase protein